MTDFIFTVETTSSNETFTIPHGGGTFSYTVSWGDGNSDTGVTSSPTHTYTTARTYTITITGTFPSIKFNNGGDKLKVRTVQQLGDVGWTSFYQSWYGCSNMTSFTANTGADTSSVTSMATMFYDCSSLTSLDLDDFNTSSVTRMESMLRGCSSLTSLDLDHFNTSSVTKVANMFRGCSSLTSLAVSNFDTSLVANLSNMFYDCSSLTSLDVSSFNTSSVTLMSSMFFSCSSLTSLDLNNFDTSSVTSMSSMFYVCSSLTSLDVSSFDTSSVTKVANMFRGCSSLTSLAVSNFDTSSVTSMSNMFYDCSNLTGITIHGWNVESLTSGSAMFSGSNSAISTAEYDRILKNWSKQSLQSNVSIHFGDAEASTAVTSPKLTYGTTSNSTMTNSSGEIVWAPHNLLPYSEDFSNAAWTKTNISFTTQVQAPDGTTTAWEFSPPSLTDPGSSGLQVRTYDTVSSKAGDKLTWSVFVKPVVTKSLYVGNPDGGDVERDVFIALNSDKSSGSSYWNADTASWASVDADHEEFSNSVGNGWYHIGITYTVSADDTSNNHFVYMTNRSFNPAFDPYPSGSEVVHIWGAHVYRSDLGGMAPVPGAATGFEYYVPTNGAVEYLPRVGHHVYDTTTSTWVNEGLLLESEARTNVRTYSTVPDSNNAYRVNATSTSSSETAPDGSTDAVLLTATGTSADNAWDNYNNTYGSYDETVMTYSFWIKAEDATSVTLGLFGKSVTYTFATDSITTPTDATGHVEHYGNGWVRLGCTATQTNPYHYWQIKLDGVDDTTKTAHVWGVQLEIGEAIAGTSPVEYVDANTMSSYMPSNATTQGFRDAQTLAVPSSELGWYNYASSELVTNDAFDTGTTNWTGSNATLSVSSGELVITASSNVANCNAYTSITTTIGQTYVISVDHKIGSKNQDLLVGTAAGNGSNYNGPTITSDQTEVVTFVATATTTYITIRVFSTVTGDTGGADNVSVREINPVALSLAVEGRITASDDAADIMTLAQWKEANTQRIDTIVRWNGAYQGNVNILAYNGSSPYSAYEGVGGHSVSDGVLSPYSIAWRHTSSTLQAASAGSAISITGTPNDGVVDLSASDMTLGTDFMGTISHFRQWNEDIGETGIEGASS